MLLCFHESLYTTDEFSDRQAEQYNRTLTKVLFTMKYSNATNKLVVLRCPISFALFLFSCFPRLLRVWTTQMADTKHQTLNDGTTS